MSNEDLDAQQYQALCFLKATVDLLSKSGYNVDDVNFETIKRQFTETVE